MTQHTDWMNNWLDMARTSFETSTRAFENISQQTERAVELGMNSANIMQGETRKMYDSWLDNMKNARKIYTEALQSGFNSLDSQIKTKPAKK